MNVGEDVRKQERKTKKIKIKIKRKNKKKRKRKEKIISKSFTRITEKHQSNAYLDFYTSVSLTVMDSDDRADHRGDNDTVTQVSLDRVRLLSRLQTHLGLEALVDEVLVLGQRATATSMSATAAAEELKQLILGHHEELVQVNATVLKFTEGSLLGSFGHHGKCCKEKL